MNKCKFDERQLYIRGNIFKHMTIAFVVLLFCDAFLTSNGLIWASSWASNVIIILIVVAIGSNEMIFREVYIAKDARKADASKLLIIVLGICAGLRIFWSCTDIARGYQLINRNQLTDKGVSLVIGLLICSIVIGYLIKTVLKMKEKPDD